MDGPVCQAGPDLPGQPSRPHAPPTPAGQPGAPRSPRTRHLYRNLSLLFRSPARGAALGGVLRPVVVPAEDLEHRGDVLPILDGVAYVALHPGPMRTSAASREDALAHLTRNGEVGYPVAVDVPDLALTIPKRGGAEPAGLRGHAGPGEDLPLDSQKVAVH